MARMDIGYARVSTEEQNLDLQLQALEAAGCEVVYKDQGVSGAAAERPGLASALAAARCGDVLVVWKLDRLGRSLPHLVVLGGLLIVLPMLLYEGAKIILIRTAVFAVVLIVVVTRVRALLGV